MIKTHLQTIFSFHFYQRLANATRGQMVWFALYIFLLNLVVFNLYVNLYVEKRLPLLLKNFPQLTFTKGELTAPNTPVFVRVPQTDYQLVFDNSAPLPPAKDDFLNRKILLFVQKDKAYMPSPTGVQSQALPKQLDFITSQDFLSQHEEELRGLVGAIAFMSSFLMIPTVMLFAFCLAGSVGFFLRTLLRKTPPVKTILKWALFLWGPISALWMMNLFFSVPLFSFAVFILCIIYMQQILNRYPQEK